MPTFLTSFSQPPAVGSVSVVADQSRSAIDVSWTSSGIADGEFWRYRIMRRRHGATDWEEAGSVYAIATLTFADIAAPHNALVDYSVRVDNGYLESDDVIASTTLALEYWIVDLADPTLRFALPHVQGYQFSEEPEQEEFRPVGRGAPLIVEGERLPPKGTITMFVTPSDAGAIELLRRAAAVMPFVLLKDAFGEVLSVKLGTIGSDRGQAGNRVVTAAFTSVA